MDRVTLRLPLIPRAAEHGIGVTYRGHGTAPLRSRYRCMMPPNKKSHHYVPQAYLRSFCDADGRVHVYRKDDPAKELRLAPQNAAIRKYYYSQPTPSGEFNHDALEDVFSVVESDWPGIIDGFRSGRNMNAHLKAIASFMVLQRVRVPAFRDAVERQLAAGVKAEMQIVISSGDFPELRVCKRELLDCVDIAIDPHQSIHAMILLMKGIGRLIDSIGLVVVRNDTKVPFISSDNPVSWYDPSLPEEEIRPYGIMLDGHIELLFPIAPDLLILGDSCDRDRFVRHGLAYTTPRDEDAVRTINSRIARFGYEAVFADRSGFSDVVQECSDVSPILETYVIGAGKGAYIYSCFAFGKRVKKPKWNEKQRPRP